MANALITVAGVDLPEPSAYSGISSTLVDSGRNVKGEYIGAVVRDSLAKVELSWNYLTVAQWASILSLFKNSAGGNFVNSVTFFDQTTGNYTTAKMYVSDRSSGLWRRDPATGSVLGWTNCKLSLIEA